MGGEFVVDVTLHGTVLVESVTDRDWEEVETGGEEGLKG